MNAPTLIEANYDGLVGPTHNYAGLSFGNVASQSNKGNVANPRKAALQGLDKMRMLHERGFTQGIIPPLLRPDLRTLHALGFSGSPSQVIHAVADKAPHLLRAVYSVSSMWTANAATVVPSADSQDGRTHFVPANLVATFHRSLEPRHTAQALRRLFPGESFVHHAPLPSHPLLGDEGAANHTRLTSKSAAVHLFVYGKSATEPGPKLYPARQTREASEAVARLCRVEACSVFVQQAPDVIDAGVFHNDVIAVGNERALLFHERAFAQSDAIDKLRSRLDETFVPICIRQSEVSVEDCVQTYLFNSQLITNGDGSMLLVAPAECENHKPTRIAIDRLCGDEHIPIAEVVYMDLRESMQNGGGPACLRLRVPLGDQERKDLHQQALYTPALDTALRQWIGKHYRDKLTADDLRDPALVDEVRTALDALAHILALPDLYTNAPPSL